MQLWIGGFAVAGQDEGIWQVTLDPVTGELSGATLVVETPSPAFLALHPEGHTLYAVSEVEEGAVSAFATDSLAPRGTRPTAGAHPCHVMATARALHLTNYGSGELTTVALDADGALTGDPQTHPHTGSGPDPERQDGPHAHSSARVGDEVWVADLGTDELRRYRPAGGGVDPAGIAAVLPAGSGPRHFVTLPGAVVVATELDSGVCVLEPGEPGDPYRVTGRHDACRTTPPAGGRNYPSHIALSDDGSLLFVAVRGADVIATFAVDGAAVRHLADTPTGGRWPRHFAVIGDLVVVANQNSSDLAVLRIDQVTGHGTLLGVYSQPSPGCVLPVP